MTDTPGRTVHVVLVTGDGDLIGGLPPFPVSDPWWPEVTEIVDGVHAGHGVRITVLRVLAADRDVPHGGTVTYLAEAQPPVPAADPTWSGDLADHPRRLSYARPGGPAADLAWAFKVLARHDLHQAGAPRQIRTWNLSSIWRIPLPGEDAAWLKVVPPFFAHEGAMIAALNGQPVPTPLAYDGPRLLLRDIPGDDLYATTAPASLTAMVDVLVDLQIAYLDRIDHLPAMPDWRATPLAAAIADVVGRTAVPATTRAALDDLLTTLPRRFAALAACGIPDTVVHGDLHPGNFRGTGDAMVLLDWGDCGIVHPLLDQSAFFDAIPAAAAASVRAHWHTRWRRAVPGCDPDCAAALVAPLAAARQAVIYRHFLDNIEPSEHVYHRADPPACLERAAVLAVDNPM